MAGRDLAGIRASQRRCLKGKAVLGTVADAAGPGALLLLLEDCSSGGLV